MTMHHVQPGERLSAIADHHQVSVADILRANPRKPRVTLASGETVFRSLAAGEDIDIPQTLGATGDSCSTDDDCNGGTCVFGFCVGGGSAGGGGSGTGASNVGQQCTDGNGNSGVYDSNGVCQASNASSGSSSISGNIFCPGPNMNVSITQLACVCDDGYVPSVNPGCVLPSDPTALQNAPEIATCQQSGGAWSGGACVCPSGLILDGTGACSAPSDIATACSAGGGTWNGSACLCPQGTTWAQGQCMGDYVNPGTGGTGGSTTTAIGANPPTGGGGSGGGGGVTKTGGGTSTTTTGAPPSGTNALMGGSIPTWAWITAGVVTLGAVGAGTFAIAHHHKQQAEIDKMVGKNASPEEREKAKKTIKARNKMKKAAKKAGLVKKGKK